VYKSKAAVLLSDAEVTNLSCNNLTVKFKKGDSIITQGTFSTNVIYLRSGIAKIHIHGPHHEQIIRIVKAPRYLGLPTTIGDKINQYSVSALSDVEVCFIDITTFRSLLKETEHFSFEIILDMCKDELESMRRCAMRTQKQTRGNIADVILDFSDNIFDSEVFTLPVSQTEIGNLVDTSRESVSRILSEFHNEGIIRLTNKKVEILNKKSLLLISHTG
jgi:CRP/FNR family transcriptional regulator